MKKEIWKDIPGYEGWHKVSNLGRVHSLNKSVRKKNSHVRYFRDRITNGYHDNYGYFNILISTDKKRVRIAVHRLVLMAFRGLPVGNQQCNHKNGIKDDNRLENLEWVSPSENIKHAYRTGLKKRKLTEDNVYAIKVLLNIRESIGSIAERYEVGGSTISNINSGKFWSHIKLESSFKAAL